MSNSFFYKQVGESLESHKVIMDIEQYVEKTNQQIYVINKPLAEKKYTYKYENEAILLLVPKHKVIFLNLGDSTEDFAEFIEEFIEDLGVLADKFEYKEYIGRPKSWKKLIYVEATIEYPFSIEALLAENYIVNLEDQRICELLISLLTGSINNIEKVKSSVPDNILDKVKQKIILFDGDQTRFIYQKNTQPKITIQGLSGTGKTELLLHKLRELYTASKDTKIMFTCFNKILAANLRKRIPEFFNFMKVEEQIKWNERFWMVNAWGSKNNRDSGAYRYICDFYNINFYTYSYNVNFDIACKSAIEEINEINSTDFEYAFDYMLIDESQDFPPSFFELCEKVTEKTVYIAGDIFQNIFDTNLENSTSVDFLLSRCYRTDPRTLMFAHAVGMGLFEATKLNWLTDDEWRACGYLIEKNGYLYKLKREPLRRFEDLDINDFESMKLIRRDSDDLASIQNNILTIISEIKDQNPTVKPDDIGIIFLDENKDMYRLADMLERSIPQQFDWITNKAYETKYKLENAVFISNKNNVKGLEFPFVICIVKNLRNELKFRNALYMMLTRSFIQSYLLIAENERIDTIATGLHEINTHSYIATTCPSTDELEHIKKTIIEYKNDNNLSYKDFLTTIFNECKIGTKGRQKLGEMLITAGFENNFDRELIVDFIKANEKFVMDGR